MSTAMLEQTVTRMERSSTIVELKLGSGRNLFLVHDGDGDVSLYQHLARKMPLDIAVFGIMPSYMLRVPLPYTTIEEMARSYIKVVRTQQPQGPYLLGGLCAGGVIAYEMACQLSNVGETVEIVVLLDAATPQALKRPGRIMKERFGHLKEAITRTPKSGQVIGRAYSLLVLLSRSFMNAVTWELADRSMRLWARARFWLLRELLSRDLPWPRYVPELTLRQIYECAEASYHPKVLCGVRALLVRAKRRTPIVNDTPYIAIYADETFGWGATVRDLHFVDVDGGHGTMLQDPFVQSLATELLLHLDTAPYADQKE